jgi:hypothetical protein
MLSDSRSASLLTSRTYECRLKGLAFCYNELFRPTREKTSPDSQAWVIGLQLLDTGLGTYFQMWNTVPIDMSLVGGILASDF